MELSNRHYVSGSRYRFGFQGQEGDDEWSGSGNMLAFKYRIHDARLGRFLSVDPLAPEYPWNSSYAFSENRVIDGVEFEGLEVMLITPANYHPSYNAVDNFAVWTQRFVAGFVNGVASGLQYGGEVICSGGESLHGDVAELNSTLTRDWDRMVDHPGQFAKDFLKTASDGYNLGQATAMALPVADALAVRLTGQGLRVPEIEYSPRSAKSNSSNSGSNVASEVIDSYPEEMQKMIISRNFGVYRDENHVVTHYSQTMDEGVFTTNLWSIQAPEWSRGTGNLGRSISSWEAYAKSRGASEVRLNLIHVENEGLMNLDYASRYGYSIDATYEYTSRAGKPSKFIALSKKF